MPEGVERCGKAGDDGGHLRVRGRIQPDMDAVAAMRQHAAIGSEVEVEPAKIPAIGAGLGDEGAARAGLRVRRERAGLGVGQQRMRVGANNDRRSRHLERPVEQHAHMRHQDDELRAIRPHPGDRPLERRSRRAEAHVPAR